jgi:hypothetical protein
MDAGVFTYNPTPSRSIQLVILVMKLLQNLLAEL